MITNSQRTAKVEKTKHKERPPARFPEVKKANSSVELVFWVNKIPSKKTREQEIPYDGRGSLSRFSHYVI